MAVPQSRVLQVLPNISGSTLLMIWPMALSCGVVVLCGLSAGYLVSTVLGAQYPDAFPKYRGLLMTALAFPNSFAIPLTLQLTMADLRIFEHPGVLEGSEAVRDHTISLYLFSYVVWVMMRWSIGYPVLTGAMQECNAWMKKVLNPPVISCIVAVVAGLISKALLPEESTDFLAPAGTALHYVSNALVPVIQLNLGAKLFITVRDMIYKPATEDAHSYEATPASPTQSDLEMKSSDLGNETASPEGGLPWVVYPLIVVLRQGGGICLGATMGYVLSRYAGVTDNVALMVTMLQAGGPPMINLSVCRCNCHELQLV